jgi:hypothetical protein
VVQHPHPDGRCGVIQADRYEAAVLVEDYRQVARLALAAFAVDGSIEEPWMAAAQCAPGLRGHPQRKAPLGWRRDLRQRVGSEEPPPGLTVSVWGPHWAARSS